MTNAKHLLAASKALSPYLPEKAQKLMPEFLKIIPYLPKKVQKLMPGLLAFLPLALEIASLLYKHRQEIRGVIENLTKQTSTRTKKVSKRIKNNRSALPKKVHRLLKYLPYALEIAKAYHKKKHRKVQRLTNLLPKKIKKKISKLLK